MCPTYRPSDEVICKIKGDEVIQASQTGWDETHNFEIVVTSGDRYFVYVPVRMVLKGMIYADQYNARKHGIPKRFEDSKLLEISDDQIVKLYKRFDGKSCKRCSEFFQFSEGNQPDGSLICFCCRQDKWR